MNRTRAVLVWAFIALGVPIARSQTSGPPGNPPTAPRGSSATDDAAQRPSAPPAASPEVASYEVGLMLGRQLYQNGLSETAQWDALVRGLKDGLAGTVATNEQRAQANQFLKAGREAVTERNRAEARAFLDQNGKAAGISTTASGLQYKVVADGDARGQSPLTTDQVTVHYRVSLADGVEFDSSYAHGQTATVRMASIIKGWREALLMMKPGAKWQLFVPPDLAYGNSPPPAIPPGALLIYELEFVRVEAPPRAELKPPNPTPKRPEPPMAPDAITPK